MNHINRLFLLPILSVGAVYSAEPSENIHDIRVGVSALPTSATTTVTNSSGYSATESSNIDSVYGASIGYQFTRYDGSLIGIHLGVGLDLIESKDSSAGATFKTDSVGIFGQFGVAYRPAHQLTIELAALVGGGRSTGDIKSATVSASLEGHYQQAGGILRGIYLAQPHFQLFGQIGYVTLSQVLDYNGSAYLPFQIKADVEGLTYGIGAGYQF